MPPVDSMEPLWHDEERLAVESLLRAAIVGSDTTVQAGLERLVSRTHANEVIILTDTYEHSDRIDSYERVARIAKDIKPRHEIPRRSLHLWRHDGLPERKEITNSINSS